MFRFNDPITDAEHDFLINRFSELCEIVALETYDPQHRRDLVDLLIQYTSNHFHREEEVMRRAGYPDLEAHILSHAYMQADVYRLRQSMPLDAPNLRSDVALMRELFLKHILTEDELFGAWLAQQRSASATPRI